MSGKHIHDRSNDTRRGAHVSSWHAGAATAPTHGGAVLPLARLLSLLLSPLALIPMGCDGAADFGEDEYGDAGDAVGDGDGDGDDDGPPDPPLPEGDGDFGVPAGAGRFVYAASEQTNRLAVIDGPALAVDVVDTCPRPSAVTGLPSANSNEGDAALLCLDSTELALVHTSADGSSTLERWPVRPGANAIAASGDGRFVVAYRGSAQASDPSGSTQDIVIVDREAGQAYPMIVGVRPREFAFDLASQRLFVLSDDGVNRVDLAALGGVAKPPLIPTLQDTAAQPDTWEVAVIPQFAQAIARSKFEPILTITDLNNGDRFDIALPAPPTDLDVTVDGARALVLAPPLDPALEPGSWLYELPIPTTPSTQLETIAIFGEYVAYGSLADGGDTLLAYTPTVPDAWPGPDARQRLTVLRRGSGGWLEQIPLFMGSSISSIGVAPGGQVAVALHPGADAENPSAPYRYTLIDLSQQIPLRKKQSTVAPPKSVRFAADGSRALLSFDWPGSAVGVDHIDLDSFIVDAIAVGSEVTHVGVIEQTDTFYVGQRHAAGRITFIDDLLLVSTITGFELVDDVKD